MKNEKFFVSLFDIHNERHTINLNYVADIQETDFGGEILLNNGSKIEIVESEYEFITKAASKYTFTFEDLV
jgi:hypothetical protein